MQWPSQAENARLASEARAQREVAIQKQRAAQKEHHRITNELEEVHVMVRLISPHQVHSDLAGRPVLWVWCRYRARCGCGVDIGGW